MEYYLAIKRNEVLIHATTHMNLKNIMLNEKKLISGCLRPGEWRVTADETGVSFWSDKKVLKLIVVTLAKLSACI